MKSNYKRLGDYIVPCDEKNTGNIIKKLQGISNQKYFQKAKTNTIGVDLEKYRIVRTGQFAFNRATTRNGDKISIALRQGKDCIVSPSYRIFKSSDENILNSEYLMMWFKRPEFDRFARFKSHGSAHEFFDYDEMCEVELPIPSIEKQREIVREYNVIQNRIALNNQLIAKLEETAQAIYKQWFVDFEFPDENGKPYKSNGGEMVWCEELEKEIPEGWKIGILENISNLRYGKMLDSELFLDKGYPVFSGYGVRGYYTEYMYKEPQILVLCRGVSGTGEVRLSPKFAYITNLSIVVETKSNVSKLYLFYFLKNEDLKSLDSGSAQSMITTGDLYRHRILNPRHDVQKDFESKIQILLNQIEITNQENQKIVELKELLLAKMTKVEIEIENIEN